MSNYTCSGSGRCLQWFADINALSDLVELRFYVPKWVYFSPQASIIVFNLFSMVFSQQVSAHLKLPTHAVGTIPMTFGHVVAEKGTGTINKLTVLSSGVQVQERRYWTHVLDQWWGLLRHSINVINYTCAFPAASLPPHL